MMRTMLEQAKETASQGDAFRHYVEVRARVLDMLEQHSHTQSASCPSDYWKEELGGFDYMLEASPLIIEKLRHHCYHLTGLRPYDYRAHHAHQRELFVRKLKALQREDQDHLLVPESPLLGGFGHSIDGALFNVDTLKFYESLIALSKAGLLASFRAPHGERKVVLEIGAGWGGFAYQFKTLCPRVTYIIVDLPQSLLFSVVYLKTLFPSAAALVYGDKPGSTLLDGYQAYDFIFLPHDFMDRVQLARLDLAINMVSFQEMTSDQVERYAHKVHELRCPSLYSLNRDRSPHNAQLTTVSQILGRYFELSEVKVLEVPYTALRLPPPRRSIRARLRRVAGRIAGWDRERSVHAYRHLAGVRRQGREPPNGHPTDGSAPR
jgi:putative sugar O-methyltransferase